jgi:hypothetical protein
LQVHAGVMRPHHGQDVGSHVLASIMDVLFKATLGALALLDDGLWSGWSVGWPFFRFHADQV